MAPQSEAVPQPVLDRVGKARRVRRVRQHTTVHGVERRAVECGVTELLCTLGVHRMPMHDGGARVGAPAGIGAALGGSLRNVGIRERADHLVEADLDDDGISVHHYLLSARCFDGRRVVRGRYPPWRVVADPGEA